HPAQLAALLASSADPRVIPKASGQAAAEDRHDPRLLLDEQLVGVAEPQIQTRGGPRLAGADRGQATVVHSKVAPAAAVEQRGDAEVHPVRAVELAIVLQADPAARNVAVGGQADLDRRQQRDRVAAVDEVGWLEARAAARRAGGL